MQRWRHARRVPARWRFRPSALWQPIPPLRGDEREAGPKRPKWRGDAPPPSAALAAYLVLTLAGTLAGSVVLLLNGAAMHPARQAAGALLSLTLLSLLCRVCDGDGGPGGKLGMPIALSCPLLPLMAALLFA